MDDARNDLNHQAREDEYGGYEDDFRIFNNGYHRMFHYESDNEDYKNESSNMTHSISKNFDSDMIDYTGITDELKKLEEDEWKKKMFHRVFMSTVNSQRLEVLNSVHNEIMNFGSLEECYLNVIGDLLEYLIRTRDKEHFKKLIELVGPKIPGEYNSLFQQLQDVAITPTFSSKEYTLWDFCAIAGTTEFVEILAANGYAPAKPSETLCSYARYMSLHDDLEYSFLDVSILTNTYQHYNPMRRCLPVESKRFVLAEEDIISRKKHYKEIMQEEEKVFEDEENKGEDKSPYSPTDVRKYLSDIINDVKTNIFDFYSLLLDHKEKDATLSLRVMAAAICLMRKQKSEKLGEKTFEWLKCLNVIMQPLLTEIDEENTYHYFKIFTEFVIVVDDQPTMKLMLENKEISELLASRKHLLIDGLTPLEYAQRVKSQGVLSLLEQHKQQQQKESE